MKNAFRDVMTFIALMIAGATTGILLAQVLSWLGI